MRSFHDDYGSPADARSYAAELNYQIGHPEEEDLTDEDVKDMRRQISEIKEYLAGIDEVL